MCLRTIATTVVSSPSDAIPDDSPIYLADDFRMFCFKVAPCPKRYSHDWATCPFAHPSEKAKRRDPRCHTGVACPAMKSNFHCPRGQTCKFAHNAFEYWLHPTRYRTHLCNDGMKCRRKNCFFAHTLEELRDNSPNPAGRRSGNNAAAGAAGPSMASGSPTPSLLDSQEFAGVVTTEAAVAAGGAVAAAVAGAEVYSLDSGMSSVEEPRSPSSGPSSNAPVGSVAAATTGASAPSSSSDSSVAVAAALLSSKLLLQASGSATPTGPGAHRAKHAARLHHAGAGGVGGGSSALRTGTLQLSDLPTNLLADAELLVSQMQRDSAAHKVQQQPSAYSAASGFALEGSASWAAAAQPPGWLSGEGSFAAPASMSPSQPRSVDDAVVLQQLLALQQQQQQVQYAELPGLLHRYPSGGAGAAAAGGGGAAGAGSFVQMLQGRQRNLPLRNISSGAVMDTPLSAMLTPRSVSMNRSMNGGGGSYLSADMLHEASSAMLSSPLGSSGHNALSSLPLGMAASLHCTSAPTVPVASLFGATDMGEWEAYLGGSPTLLSGSQQPWLASLSSPENMATLQDMETQLQSLFLKRNY